MENMGNTPRYRYSQGLSENNCNSTGNNPVTDKWNSMTLEGFLQQIK